jgi:hypothetical protein
MKNIDFLPDIYRQREAMRRARLWWAMVIVLFSSAIGASALAQGYLRHRLHEELTALTPEFAAAQAQVQELSKLQSQIQRAGHEASLYTFLESPWPRTQLLAEMIHPLPDAIRLGKMNLTDEEQAKNAVQVGPRNTKAEEEAAAKASGPEKDLAKLLEDVDRRRTTIEIDGYTTDVPRLLEYVGSVNRSSLVANATLKALEAGAGNQQGRSRFNMRVLVRPSYCQGGDAATTPTTLPPQNRTGSSGGGG